MGSTESKPSYPIASVDSALRILHLLERTDRLRVADVAAALGVAHSTAHRLLAMLKYYGLVEQSVDSREYVLGPALVRLGLIALKRIDVRAIAQPHLLRLREATDETIHLGVLQGPHVLFLDSFESSRALRVASRTGSLLRAHCTSLGKALLAELSFDGLRQLYPGESLDIITKKSIASRSQLLNELAAVRAKGYAVNRAEAEEGVGSVGAAIHDHSGRFAAAISASAPIQRLSRRRILELADATVSTARSIGEQLPGS